MTTAQEGRVPWRPRNIRALIPSHSKGELSTSKGALQLDDGFGEGAERILPMSDTCLPCSAQAGRDSGSRTALQSTQGAAGNHPMTRGVVVPQGVDGSSSGFPMAAPSRLCSRRVRRVTPSVSASSVPGQISLRLAVHCRLFSLNPTQSFLRCAPHSSLPRLLTDHGLHLPWELFA